MDQSDQPIRLFALANLSSLDLDQNLFTYEHLSLDSEKCLCICGESGGLPQVIIVDLQNPPTVIRRPIKAESAIVNPNNKITALNTKNINTSGSLVLICPFDLNTNLKMQEF